ncbi:MAG: BMP family ABC transporter substrate-binding protein [Eubacterium sp.]
MKKFISVLMCVVLVLCSVFAAGCTKQQDLKYDIVLITDGGNINDGGYNQSAWNGIEEFADENNMTSRYYQPVLDNGEITCENVEKYVELAVNSGAQFIVFPGEVFAVSAYEIAPSYPEVKFVLIDAIPHSADDTTDRFVNNVMSVSFDALQSGFLAGYIAVMNGNTRLGYFGQFDSKDSANYGAGFVQGAAFAADNLNVPTTVDWADYDSALLDYDYSFIVRACYEKVDDQKEKTYTVNVVDGTGSGTYTEGSNVTITANPAPQGKVFDKWEVKSDTEGVKDKKVNISSKSDSSMNLLVEKCDCTITATYKDADYQQYAVNIVKDGQNTVTTTYAAENSQCDIEAPVADTNMVFDHWESSIPDIVEDVNAPQTKVNVSNQDITLVAVYEYSDIPTFNIVVETGEGGDTENYTSTGSGSYMAGDVVEVAAAVPQEGYMFSHWENVDGYGNSTGIAMDNEYCWNTSFEMVDRYAAICESMFDRGVTAIFAGGNDKADSAFTAKANFDYDLNVISAGSENKKAYTTVVKNYGEAVKDCLNDFKGGTVTASNCSTDGIYSTFVSEDEDIQARYDEVYKALADGTITPIRAEGGAGYDFCNAFNERNASKCLTLKGWFLPGISLPQE